jgi:hypothetical protein
MKYEVCLEKMQVALVEVELPDDATHDQIYRAAMQQPHEWKDHAYPDIHDVLEYPEEREHPPS